ncbi:MAG TPA: hypothetical protein VEF34_16525 [Syntrophobacteraceae bacterium]|nr:hypothetical protein [Syntrophobacteraceae bacterium]
MNKSLSQRFAMPLIALLYTTTITIAYIYVVSPTYFHAGMATQQIPAFLYIIQFALAMFPAFWLPLELDRPSDFQVILLYVVVVVPSIIIGFHIITPTLYIDYSIFLLILVLCIIGLSRVSSLSYIHIRGIRINRVFLWIFIIVFTLITYIFVIRIFGMPGSVLELKNVYKLRTQVKRILAEVPVIIRYMIWTQGIVINPLLQMIGLIRQNYFLIAMGIVLQIILFSITSLKSFVISVPFVFLIWLLAFKVKKNRGLVFISIISVMVIISSVLCSFLKPPVSTAIFFFLQRWLCVPGHLSGAYFDFFSQNDYVFFGNSILKGIVPYAFGQMSPAEVIGSQYAAFGSRIIPNATAHIWADGFANLGYSGLFIVTFLGAIILWIVDSIYRDFDLRVRVLLFSMVALSFTGEGLQTCLVTGGIVQVMILGIVSSRLLPVPDAKNGPSRRRKPHGGKEKP